MIYYLSMFVLNIVTAIQDYDYLMCKMFVNRIPGACDEFKKGSYSYIAFTFVT